MDLAHHQQKKTLSCAVGNDSTAQKLQGVGDYILILNSHFSGSVQMEPTGIVKKALIWKCFNKALKREKKGVWNFFRFLLYSSCRVWWIAEKYIKKKKNFQIFFF